MFDLFLCEFSSFFLRESAVKFYKAAAVSPSPSLFIILVLLLLLYDLSLYLSPSLPMAYIALLLSAVYIICVCVMLTYFHRHMFNNCRSLVQAIVHKIGGILILGFRLAGLLGSRFGV